MYKITKLTTDFFQENIWFISNENKDSVIVDPGVVDIQEISDHLDRNQLTPVAIINTHGHPDHIASAAELQKRYNLPFYIHQKEKTVLNNSSSLAAMVGMTDLKLPSNINYIDDKSIKIHGFHFDIILTPGHTPGSMCIKFDNHLVSGDTLFMGSVGRVDLPGGSMEQMMESITKLKKLDTKLQVYPGHGPNTTIGKEVNQNPYF